jgi:hypothetical protein
MRDIHSNANRQLCQYCANNSLFTTAGRAAMLSYLAIGRHAIRQGWSRRWRACCRGSWGPIYSQLRRHADPPIWVYAIGFLLILGFWFSSLSEKLDLILWELEDIKRPYVPESDDVP